MKIQKDLFEKFLSKASLNGSIDCGTITFSEVAITFSVRTVDNIALSSVTLDKKFVLEYEALGKVPVENLSILLKAVRRMSGDVKLTKSPNMLVIEDSRNKCEFVLTSEEFIKNDMDVPKLELPVSIKLDRSVFDDAISNSKAIAQSDKRYKVVVGKSDVKVVTENSNIFSVSAPFVGSVSEPQTVTVGEYLENITGVLEKDVKVEVKTDMPLRIIDDFEGKILSTYLIAPIME